MALWKKVLIGMVGTATLYILVLVGIAFTFGALDAFNEDEAQAESWTASECSESRDTLEGLLDLCAQARLRQKEDSSACLGVADLQIAIANNCP